MQVNKRIYSLYERGAKLYICGCPATPQMVEKILLQRENSNWMPKIYYDQSGNLSEIHYRL